MKHMHKQIGLAGIGLIVLVVVIWMYFRRNEGFQTENPPDKTRTVDYPVMQDRSVALESGSENRTPGVPPVSGSDIAAAQATGGVSTGGEISVPDPEPRGFCDEMMMISNLC
jgi:hypothetical protein